MPKQSILDDDAQIYHPRKQQTEREKLQEMSFREKLSYIWAYYKFYILASLAAIALVIYFVHAALNPAPSTRFYAALIDNTLSESVLEQNKSDFTDYLQLDSKRERIELNASFYFASEDQYSMNMKQALATYISTSEVDVIIAPESQFHDYAYRGYFSKLSDELPTDIYSSLTDQFYITDMEEDTEKDAYGIYLTDTKLYKNNTVNTEPYVLGILVNSEHREASVEFIRFLFNENK